MLPAGLRQLLSRLDTEAREAASLKDADALRDAKNAELFAQKTEEESRSVNEARDAAGGAFNTERKRPMPKTHGKKKTRQKENKKEARFFRDPNLGGNIDIEG
jgi:Asp-tRNA(Asn)/Glu-tRNA(Gln) amidotransferase B subunit